MFKQISIFILIIILFNCGKSKIVNSDEQIQQSFDIITIERQMNGVQGDIINISSNYIWLGYFLYKGDDNNWRKGNFDIVMNDSTLFISFNMSNFNYTYKTFFIRKD